MSRPLDEEPRKTRVEQFGFEGESCSLARFIDQYGGELPVVARVVEGFCSPEETFTFSGEDVYWISHVKKQKRIIGRSNENLNFSIPFDHRVRFYVREDGHYDRTPSTIADIFKLLENGSNMHLYLQPVKPEKVRVWQSAETDDVIELPTMQLVDTYEETYLVASPIIMRELFDHRCPIPVFLPLKLTAATRLLKHKKKKLFQKEMDRIKEFAQSFPNADAKGNPEIMVLTAAQVEEYGSDYEKINPYIILDHVTKSKKAKPRQPYEQVKLGPTLPPAGSSPPSLPGRQPSRSHRLPAPPPEPAPNPARLDTPQRDAPGIRVHLNKSRVQNDYSALPEVFAVTSTSTDAPAHSTQTTGAADDTYTIDDEEVYAELGQVPQDINFRLVSKKQIGEFLRLLKLHKFVEVFDEQDIDGPLLMDLSKDDLQEEFKFSRIEALKLMKFVKDGWRPS